jgi:hypothetical protein
MPHTPPRIIIRRTRQGILLACLLATMIWSYMMWRADNRVFAWTEPVRVMVVALVDPETPLEGEELEELFHEFLASPRTLDGNLAGVAKWLDDQRERYSTGGRGIVDFTSAGPFKMREAPPIPPPDSASFLDRWSGTRAFLEYFEDIGKDGGLGLGAYDVTVFVYFFAEERAPAYKTQHSMASRRNGVGVVFAPLGREHLPRSAALLAHELLHTFGASDKYDGARSLYPDGYAEPDREPRYPQDHAEVMALGIPIAPGRERRVNALSDCVVGRKTAQEIGWIGSSPLPE